jgi:thioredoxin 1
MIEVQSTDYKQNVEESDKLVVVDFYADWCGPCKILSPILEDLVPDNENVRFVKVNIENSPDLANKFGIRSVPTLLFIKDGKVVDKLLGAYPKPTIQGKIDENL